MSIITINNQKAYEVYMKVTLYMHYKTIIIYRHTVKVGSLPLSFHYPPKKIPKILRKKIVRKLPLFFFEKFQGGLGRRDYDPTFTVTLKFWKDNGLLDEYA